MHSSVVEYKRVQIRKFRNYFFGYGPEPIRYFTEKRCECMLNCIIRIEFNLMIYYIMRMILQQIQNVSSSHLFQTMVWLLFIPVSNVINPYSTFSHNHEYPLLNYLVLNGSDNSFITFLFISGPILSLVERSRMDLVFINFNTQVLDSKTYANGKIISWCYLTLTRLL